MAFLSVIVLFVGRDLFGWAGSLLAVLLIILVARGLHPVIIRWIRGDQP